MSLARIAISPLIINLRLCPCDWCRQWHYNYIIVNKNRLLMSITSLHKKLNLHNLCSNIQNTLCISCRVPNMYNICVVTLITQCSCVNVIIIVMVNDLWNQCYLFIIYSKLSQSSVTVFISFDPRKLSHIKYYICTYMYMILITNLGRYDYLH